MQTRGVDVRCEWYSDNGNTNSTQRCRRRTLNVYEQKRAIYRRSDNAHADTDVHVKGAAITRLQTSSRRVYTKERNIPSTCSCQQNKYEIPPAFGVLCLNVIGATRRWCHDKQDATMRFDTKEKYSVDHVAHRNGHADTWGRRTL